MRWVWSTVMMASAAIDRIAANLRSEVSSSARTAGASVPRTRSVSCRASQARNDPSAAAPTSSANKVAVPTLSLGSSGQRAHHRNQINVPSTYVNRHRECDDRIGMARDEDCRMPAIGDQASRRQSALRQGERERRAGALLAPHTQIPAHRLGEIAADRQAEARSLFGVGQTASDLHERGEDRLEVGGLDADAGIGDMQGDRLAAVLPRHLDAAAGGRELDRVRQEVNENLLYLRPIRAHRQIERVLAAMKRQLSLAKLRLDHRN